MEDLKPAETEGETLTAEEKEARMMSVMGTPSRQAGGQWARCVQGVSSLRAQAEKARSRSAKREIASNLRIAEVEMALISMVTRGIIAPGPLMVAAMNEVAERDEAAEGGDLEPDGTHEASSN